MTLKFEKSIGSIKYWIKVRTASLENCCSRKLLYDVPVDTGRKLNVHKTFRRRPGRLLNVLCMFNLRPVSTGVVSTLRRLELHFLNFEIVLLPRSNLWLIITFSCLSFQSSLLDIAWYLFLWICIQFRLHSQS